MFIKHHDMKFLPLFVDFFYNCLLGINTCSWFGTRSPYEIVRMTAHARAHNADLTLHQNAAIERHRRPLRRWSRSIVLSNSMLLRCCCVAVSRLREQVRADGRSTRAILSRMLVSCLQVRSSVLLDFSILIASIGTP